MGAGGFVGMERAVPSLPEGWVVASAVPSLLALWVGDSLSTAGGQIQPHG